MMGDERKVPGLRTFIREEAKKAALLIAFDEMLGEDADLSRIMLEKEAKIESLTARGVELSKIVLDSEVKSGRIIAGAQQRAEELLAEARTLREEGLKLRSDAVAEREAVALEAKRLATLGEAGAVAAAKAASETLSTLLGEITSAEKRKVQLANDVAALENRLAEAEVAREKLRVGLGG